MKVILGVFVVTAILVGVWGLLWWLALRKGKD
jgi:hypothetical protein